VWFDRSAHHLVRFPASEHDSRWADALASLVYNGTERKVEVRKVDGEQVTREVSALLTAAGFVDSYRGLVLRA
jgi:hypothetical protein